MKGLDKRMARWKSESRKSFEIEKDNLGQRTIGRGTVMRNLHKVVNSYRNVNHIINITLEKLSKAEVIRISIVQFYV